MRKIVIVFFVFILLFSLSFTSSAKEKKYCDFDEICEINSFDVVEIGGNDFFAIVGIFQEFGDLYEPYTIIRIGDEQFYPGRLKEGDKFPFQEGKIEGKMIIIEKIDWRENASKVSFILERNGCLGCKMDEKCYPFETVNAEKYCSESEMFLPQLEKKEYCKENFQCLTGLCLDSKCKSNSGISRFFRKISSWF